MPSRELSYRVSIDTGTARREAQNIRRAIESELRTINTGSINSNAARTAGSAIEKQVSSSDQALRSFNNTIGAFGLAIGVQQTARFVTELAQIGTEAKRSQVSFELLSGSAKQADANLRAIQLAGNGTINSFEAIKIGTQAAALGLANTSEEFGRLTRAARLISTASPAINDVNDALAQLSLFAANESSFMRADQLLLGAQEVKDRMKELRAENELLTGSQAKLEASIQLVEEKLGASLDTIEAQASGYERLRIAVMEARIELSKGPVGNAINDGFNAVAVGVDTATGKVYELQNVLGRIPREVEKLRSSQLGDNFLSLIGPDPAAVREDAAKALEQSADVLKRLQDAVDAGVPGAEEYRDTLIDQTLVILEANGVSQDMINTLTQTEEWYKRVAASVDEYKNSQLEAGAADAAVQAAEARAASLLESQASIDSSLVKRASEASGVIGIESALATLKEQKSLVDAAITELIDSAITDPDELNIRLAELQDNVLGFFDQVEERAQSVNIDFAGIDTALAQFDGAFIDFLPGLDGLRDQLVDLQSELAFTGSITAEQAAELEYLQAAASAAGGEAVFLSAVTNELGTEFLATNEHAALLVDAMYRAVAAYLNGSITAEQYAGVTAALGGQLLTLASEAGIATGAINELIAAQGGLAGTEGFAAGQIRGNSIAQGIATRQQEAQRRQARIDAERAAREQQRLQEKAARDAQRAWEKAAKETQKAFEEAMRQLESDLRNVPGLFSPTSVTEQDMQFSEAGIYTDQADEYLRRLRDEVLNGTDWADVSIEDAKQSLRELGINVAEDNKLALQQFEQSWTNSALFADAENIAKYINDEAVQAALDLQEKARQGQQNILEHFGVVVDEAVDAVVTGAGGSYGGGGGVATIPVQAELIPATGDFTTMTTLGGVSPVIDVAAIQGQIDALDTAITLTPKVNEGAFATLIAGIQSTPINIAPKLDTTTLVEDLSKIGQQQGTIEIAVVAAGDNPALDFFTALDTQFKQASNFFYLIGQDTATQIRAGVAAGFAIQSPDGKEVDTGLIDYLVQRIGAEAVERQPRFTAAGAGIADFVLEGARNQFSPVAADGSVKSALATGMLDSLTLGIRTNASNFQQRGQSVAEYVKAGFLNQFASETFKANIEAAGGLMAGYLKQGILSNLNGIADSIATKVIDDIATSVEAE